MWHREGKRPGAGAALSRGDGVNMSEHSSGEDKSLGFTPWWSQVTRLQCKGADVFRNNAVPTRGIAVTSHTSQPLRLRTLSTICTCHSKSKAFSLAESCRQVSRRSCERVLQEQKDFRVYLPGCVFTSVRCSWRPCETHL